MQTVLVQINDCKAYKLLQELEELNIKDYQRRFFRKKTKLSDKYKGVFSKEEAANFNNHTLQMRKE